MTNTLDVNIRTTYYTDSVMRRFWFKEVSHATLRISWMNFAAIHTSTIVNFECQFSSSIVLEPKFNPWLMHFSLCTMLLVRWSLERGSQKSCFCRARTQCRRRAGLTVSCERYWVIANFSRSTWITSFFYSRRISDIAILFLFSIIHEVFSIGYSPPSVLTRFIMVIRYKTIPGIAIRPDLLICVTHHGKKGHGIK